MSRRRSDHQPRARKLLGRAARVLDRRAQVVLALDQEDPDVRQRAGAERRLKRGVRPALTEGEGVAGERGRAVERLERRVRDGRRVDRRLAVALARVRRRRARPRHRDLLAGGGRVHPRAQHPRRRWLGVDLEGAPAQPQQRGGVAAQPGAHGPRQGGPQGGIEVARDQDREQIQARQVAGAGPAAGVHHAPAQGPSSGDAIHEAGEIGHRVGRPRAATPAERAERSRSRRQRVEVVRVRAVELHHRVEHEPVDAVRIALRIAERQLRAI
jgi:hypothetical protein